MLRYLNAIKEESLASSIVRSNDSVTENAAEGMRKDMRKRRSLLAFMFTID